MARRTPRAQSPQAELLSLCETSDMETALETISQEVECAAVTMSEEGAVIVRGGIAHQSNPNSSKMSRSSIGAGASGSVPAQRVSARRMYSFWT